MAYKMSDDDESDVVIPWTALASSQSKKLASTYISAYVVKCPANLSSF